MNNNLLFMNQPNTSPNEIFVLTHEEQERIINQSHQHPFGFLIRFLLYTGINAEELLLLIFSDINIEFCEIDVPIVLNPINGICSVDSSVEFRTVPLSYHTLIELSNWRFTKMRACGMNACDISHQPIASTVKGKPITFHGLQRIFCEILNGCGMPYYPLSALRDSYAVRALTGGVYPQSLNAVLGESNATDKYMNYISTKPTATEEHS